MTFIKNIQGARITGSITASFAGDGAGLTGIISASNADTASYVDLVAGTNITINQTGTTYTINSAGGGGSAFPYTGSAIISGSLEVTGSVNISGSLIASGLAYPTADQEPGDVLTTDGLGNLSFNKPTVYAKVKNITAGTLPKGMPVHVTSSVGNVNEVVVASASDAATMPATFILAEQLTAGQEGLGIVTGFINGVNTSTFAEGDIVYVAAGGGYTNVKPTGSNLIQNIGIVTKIDASNGSGFIYGAGRSNDVPNITEGYTWVGNSNGVATPTATSSIQNVVSSSYAATASYAGLYSGNGTIPLNTTASVNGDLLFQGLDEDTKLIVRDGNNGSSVELFSDGNAGQASIRFVSPSNQLVHQIQQAGGETRYISDNRDLVFTTSTSSLTQGIVVQAGTGNVGIGSDATTDKLSVLGSFNLMQYGVITITSGSGGWHRIGYTSGNDRGGIRVLISYVGGFMSPSTYVINAFKNSTTVGSLSLEKYGQADLLTEVRIVQDEIDSTTYHLEINAIARAGDGVNGHSGYIYFDKNLGYEGTWNLNTGSLSASTSVAAPIARSPFTLTSDGYTFENIVLNNNINNNFWQITDTDGKLEINDWNSDNLITLDGVNDRVGIGTDTPNAKLDVSGSAIITGSLTVTGGITGSLFGTASWAQNAVTASFITTAQTASYVLNAVSASYADNVLFQPGSSGTASTIRRNASNTATANYSLAIGLSNNASGIGSVAIGTVNTASGDRSIALGRENIASGDRSFVSGYSNLASSPQSFAHGYINTASNAFSVAIGRQNTAAGTGSIALGYLNYLATGSYSFAAGQSNDITPSYGGAIGLGNIILANSGIAVGRENQAGNYAFAAGYNNQATAISSFAIGQDNVVTGEYAGAVGYQNSASGDNSYAEGFKTIAIGYASHAEGAFTTANGNYSHAEGNYTIADGGTSHAEGYNTTASGTYSHAEGALTIANGSVSHAEGSTTTASGNWSHSEGDKTFASASTSHAQGYKTITTGYASHAGGTESEARGISSFIHSSASLVTGNYSAVLGGRNITGSLDNTVYVPNLHVTGSITAPGIANAETSQVVYYNTSSGAMTYGEKRPVGNAQVDNFYYSISNSVDTRPIFEDDNVLFNWDETGNDLEFNMKVAPGGSGDMRASTYLYGGGVQSTAIVSTGVDYDLWAAGVAAGNRIEAFITAENDVTYPAYRVIVFNTGESYHNTVWIERITRI